ncbi:citron rho-interacting kinase isoform X1 [Bradysia coprophila]|uniref:citron rho-interacting kinase isoform X1 n=1 Tax=Bradysia coprophila TaxID=38358 RepID=UPI00187D7512|nr:citron rho-interacting kinase isoform X1 [Bradysia coprophila]
MSDDIEAISVRATRLNNLILGRSEATSKIPKQVANGLCRESLLDTLCLLYDECNKDHLKKKDKNVYEFVKKYNSVIKETNNLRVNINDFRVKTLIGKGYFGDVHLATEKTTNDVYAIKKILKGNAITTSQLREERDIMAIATSEWITSLQYAFQDQNHLYLVMEYLPGGDLLSLMIRHGPFEEEWAKFYIAEMTLAINALHTMGYVHRDIKPENICLDRFGHLKLADFGNALQLNKDGNAITISPVGTPDYIAPELLQTFTNAKLTKSIHGVSTIGSGSSQCPNQDNIKEEDEQFQISCDYWSMGVIAYEMLTEVTPFHNDDVNQTYNNIMNFGDFRAAEKLTFPDGFTVSPKFASLVDGLVTDASKRLSYKQIVKHPFFDGIDWTNLRREVPPIIPTISNEEDVSNFEGVDRKGRQSTYNKARPNTTCKGNEFSGQNLPYLGYSYVNPQTTDSMLPVRNQSSENLTIRIKELERTIDEHVKHIKSLQREVLDAQRQSAQTKSLEKILMEAKMELTSLKKQLEEKTAESASFKTEVKTLKSSLKIEEQHRLKKDNEIASLLNSTYQKWEKAKFASEKSYEDRLAQNTTEIISLTKNLTARESELNSKVDECKHLQSRVEKYQELLKASKQQNLEDKAEFDRKQSQVIDGYETKIRELKNKLKNEKQAKQSTSDELREVRKNLDDSICSANSITHSKIVSDRTTDEIKSRMNRQIEENKALREEKVNVERKMEELQKKCDEYSNELNRMRMEQITPNRMSDGGSEHFCSVRGSLESLSGVEELTKQLAASQENEDLLRQRAERLEQVVSRFELAVSNLEQPKSAENLLERQNEKLEGELNTVREQAILERQASRTAFLSLYKLEKQVEDLNSEKKKQHAELEKADKNLKRMRDEKDDIQVQLRDARATIRLKESRITELQSEIQNLKDDLKKEHEMWEKAELERMKEKSEIIEHVSNVHKLQEKLDEEKRKLNTVSQRNTTLDFDYKRLLKERSSLSDELAQSNEYANKLESELNVVKRNFEMLKHTCTIMNAQLDELQAMYKTEVENNKSLCEKSDNLWSQVKGHHDEFKKLRTKLNESQSLKDAAEFKCKQLTEELERAQDKGDVQHQKMVSQQEELIAKTKMLFEVQEELEVVSTEKSNLQRLAENKASELHILKEENTRILTDLYTTKEELNNLTIERKEIKNEMNLMKQELEQLNGTLIEQKNYYTQRVIKAEAIQAQFEKLSEYLQKKVEELSAKKKKSFAEVLFGTNNSSKKENIPIDGTLHTIREELKRERARSNQLKEQLLQAKTEIRTKDAQANVVEKTAVRDTTSNASTKTPRIEAESFQRTASKRKSFQAHRFEMSLESNAADCQFLICMACDKPILIGSPYWHCKECNSSVHRKCRSDVKRSCDGEDMPTVFNQLVAERDASSDVVSVSESESSEAGDYNGQLVLKTKNLHTPVVVNCVYQVTGDVLLLGCDNGLYSYNQQSCQFTHITGIDSVNYMTINANITKCVLIGSNGDTLNQCDTRQLFNRAQASQSLKPKLDTTPLEITFANRIVTERWHYATLNGCNDKPSESLLIACTSARIVVMRFDTMLDRFKPVCALDTAAPVTSILFTQHSAIVSSDKYFEIDLGSLVAEEFLNESDRVAASTKNCKPMSAHRINQHEFLLCFEEFGIFVDDYGSRSRPTELNWANRPCGFMYREPLLFVAYSDMVQIIRINKTHSKESEARRKVDDGMLDEVRKFLHFNAPKLVGDSVDQLSIFVLTKSELSDSGQHLIHLDGVKALKSISNSLDTLVSTSSMTSVPVELASSMETFNSTE